MNNKSEPSTLVLEQSSVGGIDLRLISKALMDAFAPQGPIRVAVIGETGVGKSSTINALFNTKLPINHVRSCTQIAEVVKTTTNKGMPIEIIDMPGLGAGEAETRMHWHTYREVLPTVDSAIWVISAGDKALEGMQGALRVISSLRDDNLIEHIVFGINKSEHMEPEDWNAAANLPSREQESYLEEFCETVKTAIREIFPSWNGTIRYYSAKKQFRLDDLLEQMILAAPEGRRTKLYQTSDTKSYEDKVVDKRALKVAKKL